ncbi:hypothetical protein EDD37DRAFT_320814 [Exophiala viscosa]|uniref:uncharacterized protein n=1 Tax=Exophiala viscosa TaxID=2486360 RepID=UPI00219D44D3|nr:hypothetical protein EDD37DRAFT_320814 [Exophiala viscosa]
MTVPILAAWPGRPVACVATRSPPVSTHSDSEWTALYSEIERLYIRQRRKLRYVMQYMEREHDFQATKQMYKKRFTKWGFQKNYKRSAAIACSLKTEDDRGRVASRKASPTGEPGPMPPSPRFGHSDDLALMFLSRVRVWSVAFFESVQFGDELRAPQQHELQLSTSPLRSSDAKEVSFAFKLVMDLLDRGHGDLAGRMARKAFLLIEHIWQLEGPALMWNLLEMMHHMVTLRHAQLFHMLLAHLIALADGQMPETHPFPAMLRGLRELVAGLTRTASATKGSPSLSSSSSGPSSSTGNDAKPCGTTPEPGIPLHTLQTLLERAWILNAEILFDHFDPRLILLYCSVICDSCSILPPSGIVGIVDQWFNQIKAQPLLGVTAVSNHTQGLLPSTSVEEERMIQCLLTPRMDASPPQDYKLFRERSLAALWERGNSILSKEAGIPGDPSMLLPMLAGMLTAKILEGLPLTAELNAKRPRIHAGHLACALKVLVDLDTEHGGGLRSSNLDTIERIRAMVALREYAEGQMAPQVIRDLWLLQDALTAAGEYAEAQAVERDAYRRMDLYIQDVSVDPT